MTPSPTRLLITLACCLATAPAMAAKVTKIEVAGLPDEAMQDNVRSALSLSGELDKDITARRLNYLLRQAESETREALEPFGYYSPVITVMRSDRERPVGSGNGGTRNAAADTGIATAPADDNTDNTDDDRNAGDAAAATTRAARQAFRDRPFRIAVARARHGVRGVA